MRNGASSLDDIAINAEPGCPPSSPLSYKAERDTRGRLRAEKDLRQLIEDLETRLEETKSDLLTANADLSRTAGAAPARTKDGKHRHLGERISSRVQQPS
jgi:hypothetical protein